MLGFPPPEKLYNSSPQLILLSSTWNQAFANSYTARAMEGDEVFIFLGCIFAAGFLWGNYYQQSFAIKPPHLQSNPLGLQLVPLLCALVVFIVLRKFAAHDVRNSAVYLSFYMVLGMAWLAIAERCSLYLGMSIRDDYFERGNPAAGIALAGFLLGNAFCFAGANIGEGPGWYVVVFCSFLATSTLFLVFGTLAAISGVMEAITIDRDLASGIRAAGFFAGCGLLLGEAVAGDWASTVATFVDFLKLGWRVLVLLALAAIFERSLRPTPVQPTPPPWTRGLLPGLLYLGTTIILLVMLRAK